MIESIIRKFLEYLSFFYKNKRINKNQKIYKFLHNEIKKIKYENYGLKKTHVHFNKKIIRLLETNDLSKFLREKFIQKVFFVHNRYFILKELKFLKKDAEWPFYKFLLNEDDIGDPVRFFLYPKSSGNRINHIFHLAFLKKNTTIELKKIINVFEFGGGYGCMARIFSKINKNVFFKIFDTQPVNLLQYYYLKQNKLDVGFKKNNQFQLLNNNNLNLSKKILKNSIFIANWSISETQLKFREKFINHLKKFDYTLIAFQENFENINNLKYFKNLKNKLKNNFRIKILKNPFYKGNILNKQNHYFFIGEKL